MNAKQFNSVFKVYGVLLILFIISSCNQNAKSEDLRLESVAVNENFKTLEVDEEKSYGQQDMAKPEFPKDLKIN